MPIYFFIKIKGIGIIIYLIQLTKCGRKSLFFQISHRSAQKPQICTAYFMRIQHISVPVNPHKSILLLLKLRKELLFQRSGLPEKFLRLCILSLMKHLSVIAVVFRYLLIIFTAFSQSLIAQAFQFFYFLQQYLSAVSQLSRNIRTVTDIPALFQSFPDSLHHR